MSSCDQSISSISMTGVIITSILKGFGQKINFSVVVLVQVPLFEISRRYGLETLHNCDEDVRTRTHKVFGDNSSVCRG